MGRRVVLGMICAMAITPGVAVPGVYRSVAPDGHVTYADVPPANTNAAAVATAKSESVPAPAASAAAPTRRGRFALPNATKSAIMAKRTDSETAPVTSTALRSDYHDAEAAAIGVLGIEDIVNRMVNICMETLPTSFALYDDTANKWRRRNGATVTMAEQVLTKIFTAAEHQGVKSAIAVKNSAMYAPIVVAQRAQRITWCDRSVGEIESGKMDVSTNNKLAAPLAAALAR